MAKTDPKTIIDINQDPGLTNKPAVKTTTPSQVDSDYAKANTKVVVVNYTDPPLYGAPELQIFNDPGGSNGQIQFNQGNRFAADNGLSFNSKTRTLSILGNLRVTNQISGRITTNPTNFKLTGGNVDDVLITDGHGNISWTDITNLVNYGNSNVSNYLPTHTGNVSANYFIGDGSLLTGMPEIYGNANVANYLPTYTGNVNSSNVNVSNTLYAGNISTTGTADITTLNVGSHANLGYPANIIIAGGTENYVLTSYGNGHVYWSESRGPRGEQGIQGVQGNVGPQGPQGPQGAQGEQGDVGATGPQGIQGVQGLQGIQGVAGPTGPQGATGAQGLQGVQGERGLQGVQGIKGDKGDQGLPGNDGSQGIQGPIGNTGPQGISVTLMGTLANVSDLGNVVDPVQGDAWIVTEVGGNLFFYDSSSQWDDIGRIVGPEGPRGTQGVKGDKGDQGEQGVPGSQGEQGVPGEQGEQGVPGEQGIQGIPGNQGEQGEQGVPGEQGIQGIPGVGVPAGGLAGQYLVKTGNDDYITAWIDPVTSVLISDSTPSTAIDGTVWWSSEAGRSYIKYNDQWVDMSPQQPINPDLQVDSITFSDGSVQTKSSDLGNLYVIAGDVLQDSESSSYINFKANGFNETKTLALGTNESYPVRIETDWQGNTKSWKFDTDGNLVLPNGGKVGPAQTQNGVDLYADDTHEWAQLNYNNQAWIWLQQDVGGIEIQGSSWFYTADGRIIFPDGTIQETAYPGESFAKVPVSDFPPSAEEGSVWYNSELGRAFVKYNNQWVDFSPQTVPPDAANPFDQDLNTTDNVTFNNINAGNLQINDLDATTGYIGNATFETVTANIATATVFSAAAITANYFFGDGSNLVNLPTPTFDNTILINDNVPSSAPDGTLWYKTDVGKTYVKYNEQWVDSNPQTVDARAIRTNLNDDVEIPKNILTTDGRIYQDASSGKTSIRWVNMDTDNQIIRVYRGGFEDGYEADELTSVGLTYQNANTSGLYIKAFNSDTEPTWTFEGTGNLRFPDDTIQTTAYQPATLLDGGSATSTYTSNIAPGGTSNPFDQDLNTSDNVQFLNVTANSFIGNIAIANVTGLGNIATINLTGSSANVLYGNGVFAPITATMANTTTDNFFIDGEGIGLVVDAAGLKRFGFMKYSGFEGSLTHSAYPGSAVPLRIGRVSTADVTAADRYSFTTEIYVGTNGHVRIADDTVNSISDPDERLEVTGNIKLSGSLKFTSGSEFTGTGLTGFVGNSIYNFNGSVIENADLSHGATAALILPSNGSTSAIQMNNFYGDLTVSTSNSGAGGLKTWRFSGDGNLSFPDLTNQNTAYRPVTAPTTSKGSSGDKAGMVAYSGSWFYYCTTNYTDGVADIWVRSAWDQTSWSS